MYKALIIGAGRIGAGFRWHDDAYTHAGAYKALKDRVELVGFVEPNPERADAAERKWGVVAYESMEEALTSWAPDIVSVCVQPEDQIKVMAALDHSPSVQAVWCEKPYMGYKASKPVQVNYMRRGDFRHQSIAKEIAYTDRLEGRPFLPKKLVVYGKDDLTTKCHFEDLAKWWECRLDYRPFQGPCAYALLSDHRDRFFDAGGVDGGECFHNMLKNLLDHLDSGTPLWSPADAS